MERISNKNIIPLKNSRDNNTSSTKNENENLYSENNNGAIYRLFDDEHLAPLLLDLDNETHQWSSVIDETDWFDENSTPNKKTLFDDDEEDAIDIDAWVNKSEEEWSTRDTIHWLIWACIELGHSYGLMSRAFALPGQTLVRLTRENFIFYDSNFGGHLYDLLHTECASENMLPLYKPMELNSDGESSPRSDDNCSENEESSTDSDSPTETSSKGQRLWEFIISLLNNPKYCPSWIRWENYEEKTFRFVENNKVAKLWGERRKNKNMTYDKLTRAIRYYYNKEGEPPGIFAPVSEQLVYKFGKIVEGLETDNPNFVFGNEKTTS